MMTKFYLYLNIMIKTTFTDLHHTIWANIEVHFLPVVIPAAVCKLW